VRSPLTLFRRVAIAEAVTWALLLAAMVVKYASQAPHLGELAVRVFGMAHGVVFLAYCLVTVVVAVDRRWSRGRLLLGLAASVPPFATVAFDRYAERRGALGASWRLVAGAPAGPVERTVAWLLRHPGRGAVTGAVGVAALTGLALLVGPPTG
jgi:integral membrane protein